MVDCGRDPVTATGLEDQRALRLFASMKLIRSLILMCLAAIGGLTLSAYADQAPTEGARRVALAVPADCTWESARALPVETISRDYLALYGQCVRTRGISDGNSIGPDEIAFHRADWAQLGVIFQNERLPSGRFTDAEFLGVVGACEYVCPPVEEQFVRNSDGSMTIRLCMGAGVCHWFEEYPYLMTSEFRATGPDQWICPLSAKSGPLTDPAAG